MAKPRIFVSSTYYDLKYIRASLDLFIDSLGFEPVLSEKGDIAYTSDRPLDESCYREVENADVFVLVIGGRYGSESSAGSKKLEKKFFDRYESVTKKEYDSAVAREIPIYVLIEKGVQAEYQTFIRNKNVDGISYAHVDSVNVFHLIEDILSKPNNNPYQTFEKFEDIEGWLREQWAGLFRELLRRQSQQQQLASLSQQIVQLKETNETLKKYLEAVMRGDDKRETTKLIKSEEKRLDEIRLNAKLQKSKWPSYVSSKYGIPTSRVIDVIRDSKDFSDFAKQIGMVSPSVHAAEDLLGLLRTTQDARADLNVVRELLGLQAFETPQAWEELSFENRYAKLIEMKAKVDDLRSQLVAENGSKASPDEKVERLVDKAAPKKAAAKKAAAKKAAV